MRTTIELTDRQRAKLLELAALRGEKGFSRIVQEAVDRYLEECALQRERLQARVQRDLHLSGELRSQLPAEGQHAPLGELLAVLAGELPEPACAAW